MGESFIVGHINHPVTGRVVEQDLPGRMVLGKDRQSDHKDQDQQKNSRKKFFHQATLIPNGLFESIRKYDIFLTDLSATKVSAGGKPGVSLSFIYSFSC
jgi:hypothetical protein